MNKTKPLKMNVTLKVDKKIYREYKELCASKGLWISRRFQQFMIMDMEKVRNLE